MFWRIALQRSVFLRAVKTAVIVGLVLVGINHGEALLAGEFNVNRFIKILLTFLVPYCVATYASVSALREAEKS